ncbi:hypothetical protein RCL_jg25423.t1 [Rhizophagus clarus]|uniref:Uncharacterized protein n=1 Tax=Rhizophagus clarus TaxID=94130 RepID=A0A8H3QIW1_9GLOM|nr:hypothetical protein RCL_jg25423.t1 [Rhizophagus clarus]
MEVNIFTVKLYRVKCRDLNFWDVDVSKVELEGFFIGEYITRPKSGEYHNQDLEGQRKERDDEYEGAEFINSMNHRLIEHLFHMGTMEITMPTEERPMDDSPTMRTTNGFNEVCYTTEPKKKQNISFKNKTKPQFKFRRYRIKPNFVGINIYS